MENPLGRRLREQPGPVLITGHTGFKGTWLTFLLEHLNVPVVGYSLPAEKDSLYDRAKRKDAIPEVFADIRDYEELEEFINENKPSTIIHMAAQPLVLKSYERPRETFDVNVMGTVNVLDIAFKKDFVKAIIVVTTDKVYRNLNSVKAFVETDSIEGKDPYSASKVGTEAVVAAWQQIAKLSGGPKLLSVRAGNVIGGGDWANNRLLPDLVKSKFFSQKTVIRNPNSTRPWQHVLDPLHGYLLAIENMLSANLNVFALNFGPEGKSLKVSEVTKIVFSRDELQEKIIEEISAGSDYEAPTLSLDSNLARKTVGFKPKFTQEEAIAMTINWWESVVHGEEIFSACSQDILRILD